MRSKYILILFLLLNSILYSQNTTTSNTEGMFVALIVKNIDESIRWYTQILSLEKINSNDLPERGLKQANLRREGIHVELIQLESAITPSEVLNKADGKKRITGIFKFGFKVSNFEHWQQHLLEKQIITTDDIVRDPNTNKRMVVFKDPDGNRIQIFEKD